jgi:transposase
MRKDVVVDVSAADRPRLEAIVADRNSPQKHVWRARIILLTAAGVGTVEITRRVGKSKNCVWRWQERLMQEGIAGLLRNKTRPSRIPPLGPEVAERVVALTQTEPPRETTHWTAGAAHLARARSATASGATVQAVCRPAIRCQGARYRRPLYRSAGARDRGRSGPGGAATQKGPSTWTTVLPLPGKSSAM